MIIGLISSLLIVNGNQISKSIFGNSLKNKTNYIIIFISILVFISASKGYSILYLFLLADLLCCAAVFPVFYGFYKRNLKERDLIISVIVGLLLGLLLFPSPDFSKSILVGILLPFERFAR